MKNKRKMMPMIILSIAIVTVVFTYLNANNSYEEKIINKPNKITKGIALNLEQTEGAGDYKLVTQSSWPTEGYKFNTELSKCENDGELAWDDTKKIIVFSGNVSDKCYVYFDIWFPSIADYCTNGDNLASCVKTFGDQGSDISNIYVHTSTLANGAGDNSYRYAGPSEQVNNFICFGSTTSPCPENNLYRIVGVFGENYHGVSGKQLSKLIKYDYMTTDELGTDGDYYGAYTDSNSTYKGNNYANIASYYWNYKATNSGTNIWSTSLLNKTNLNTNFINYLGTTWTNKIAVTTWKVGGNKYANIINAIPSVAYQNEIVNPTPGSTSTTGETEYKAKIGLMYVSDYGFAASPSAWTLTMGSYNNTTATNNNWMYMGLNEWTISRYASNSDYAFSVYGNDAYGGSVDRNGVYLGYVGRASFNLESSITYKSGSGSMSNPITINL